MGQKSGLLLLLLLFSVNIKPPRHHFHFQFPFSFFGKVGHPSGHITYLPELDFLKWKLQIYSCVRTPSVLII